MHVVIAALYDAPLPALRGSEFTSTQFDFVPVAMGDERSHAILAAALKRGRPIGAG